MFNIDQELDDLVLLRKTQIKTEENLNDQSKNLSQLIEIQHENDKVFNSHVEALLQEITYLRAKDPKIQFGVSFKKLVDYISGMKQHRS